MYRKGDGDMRMGVVQKRGEDSVYVKKSRQSVQYALKQIRGSAISPYVNRVILYGSCARGDQNYKSDVDLLLELSPDIDVDQYHSDLMELRGIVTPPDRNIPEVDLKIMVGDDWEDSESLYFKNIKKEGIDLWVKD